MRYTGGCGGSGDSGCGRGRVVKSLLVMWMRVPVMMRMMWVRVWVVVVVIPGGGAVLRSGRHLVHFLGSGGGRRGRGGGRDRR